MQPEIRYCRFFSFFSESEAYKGRIAVFVCMGQGKEWSLLQEAAERLLAVEKVGDCRWFLCERYDCESSMEAAERYHDMFQLLIRRQLILVGAAF